MSSDETPRIKLMAGVGVLAPVLQPHGFVFEIEAHGKSSSGWFAMGAFVKGIRRLELHFRHSLGLVTYRIENDLLDHETYMRLLGVYGKNQYPDFPVDPLDSFHHLAADIQEYCEDFTSGDAQQFHVLAADFRRSPSMFKGIS